MLAAVMFVLLLVPFVSRMEPCAWNMQSRARTCKSIVAAKMLAVLCGKGGWRGGEEKWDVREWRGGVEGGWVDCK